MAKFIPIYGTLLDATSNLVLLNVLTERIACLRPPKLRLSHPVVETRKPMNIQIEVIFLSVQVLPQMTSRQRRRHQFHLRHHQMVTWHLLCKLKCFFFIAFNIAQSKWDVIYRVTKLSPECLLGRFCFGDLRFAHRIKSRYWSPCYLCVVCFHHWEMFYEMFCFCLKVMIVYIIW